VRVGIEATGASPTVAFWSHVAGRNLSFTKTPVRPRNQRLGCACLRSDPIRFVPKSFASGSSVAKFDEPQSETHIEFCAGK